MKKDIERVNDEVITLELRPDDINSTTHVDGQEYYKKLYEEEAEANKELQKQMEDLVEKLSNMSENALTLFNERSEKEDYIKGLRKENSELIQENEFLKKQIEAGVYYRSIAEGFVGLARMNGQDIPADFPQEPK